MGHSLGGSIAVRVAEAGADLKRQCGGRIEIGGVVAVDVVEGTALATLEDMPQVGRSRSSSSSMVLDILYVESHCGLNLEQTSSRRNLQRSTGAGVPGTLDLCHGRLFKQSLLHSTSEQNHWSDTSGCPYSSFVPEDMLEYLGVNRVLCSASSTSAKKQRQPKPNFLFPFKW